MTATVSRLDLGRYEVRRAAALSGVPERTVYHWDKTGLVRASASQDRPKLWSYGDLLTLRLVRWLRVDKPDIARTKMDEVRDALEEAGDGLWTVDAYGADVPTIVVTETGRVVLRTGGPPRTVDGQQVLEDVLDLLGPFRDGVDLRRPRPRLRIDPGRVSGEPHLVGSRLTTLAVASLAERGMTVDQIATLYPYEDRESLIEAIDLERHLARAA